MRVNVLSNRMVWGRLLRNVLMQVGHRQQQQQQQLQHHQQQQCQ